MTRRATMIWTRKKMASMTKTTRAKKRRISMTRTTTMRMKMMMSPRTRKPRSNLRLVWIVFG